MKLREIIHLVWINILGSKSKVLLTSLGVIVGSATIVLVIAVGNGGQQDVAEQFKNLNAGAIEVTSVTEQELLNEQMDQRMGEMDGGFGGGNGMPDMGGQAPSFSGGQEGAPSGGGRGGAMPSMSMIPGGMSGFSSSSASAGVQLSSDDVSDIVSLVPHIAAASILTSGDAAVLAGDSEEETSYTVVGVLPDYTAISNLTVMLGQFITEDDEEATAKTAVIGYGLAKSIFGSASLAYGEVISIEGKNYEITGVLQEMGTVSSGISPDEAIYIPYSTALKYIFGKNAEAKIAVVADDVSHVQTVMENLQTVLEENHTDGYFSIADAGSEMEAAQSSANTLAMLLIAVASIVFIVGGIGIMNVLFVSVKERTQEIGILKAMGCCKREILLEFLAEALFIGTLGGILGVAAGFLLVPAVRMTGMTVEPLAIGGVLALVFAIITGTLFGFYPAYKASRLTPIQALSQE